VRARYYDKLEFDPTSRYVLRGIVSWARIASPAAARHFRILRRRIVDRLYYRGGRLFRYSS
jgi:hypothetical protein